MARPDCGRRFAAGISRVLEDAEDGWDGRRPPDQVPETVFAGQQEIAVVEEAHHLTGRLDLQEAGEDQLQPVLNLLVRMLEHAPQRVADQSHRQRQGQFTPLGFVDQSGGQACAQGVQFQFRDQALETKDQAAIRSSRIVNAVLIANEAVAVTTQVEELIPVGAVAGQARDVIGEEDAHLLLIDQGHEFLEAPPSFGGAAGVAEIRVDDPDLRLIPAGSAGAVEQIILEFKTLSIRENLVWARLSYVDQGEAFEVGGLNGFGCAHGEPP